MISGQLKKTFSIERLTKAWQWLLSNPDPQYKQYFRHIYSAFSISSDAHIKDLYNKLKNNVYEPKRSSKIFLPKKSGNLRMYTLLTVEDQIVYQALAGFIAERFSQNVKKWQKGLAFGHMFAGKNEFQFYSDWKEGYSRFKRSIKDAFETGHDYIASFDLTAFYDSIDHQVLRAQLNKYGIERELSDFLILCLSKWTESNFFKEFFQHGHGIPQGPLSSGFFAEVVLSRFDWAFRNTPRVRYFRYVDDIRLLGKSERSLRLDLVRLDLISKALGLFPQSSKINLHKIKDIQSEIKSISAIVPDEDLSPEKKQLSLINNLKKITFRMKIDDETSFKFLLPQIAPNTVVTERLIRLLPKYSHLYRSFALYFSRYRNIPRKPSSELIKILKSEDTYFTFTASLIDVLRERIHKSQKGNFVEYLEKRLKEIRGSGDPELRAMCASALIYHNAMTWSDLEKHCTWKKDWWARTLIQKMLNPEVHGKPNCTSILNTLIQDEFNDVALVAASGIVSQQLELTAKAKTISPGAQKALRQENLIRRYSRKACFVDRTCQNIFAPGFPSFRWKKFLNKHYDGVLSKSSRWQGYLTSDSTAWINITDTIIDLFLDRLFDVHGGLGKYKLGNIGGNLDPKSRFASTFPLLFTTAKQTHDLRLQADLSHPIVRKTQEATRYLTFKEAKKCRGVLRKGLLELWKYVDTRI